MFVVLQQPFADLRSFIGEASGRLARPSWPLVEPDVDFVRSFGRVRPTLGGGVLDWAGEEAFCRANAALRFPSGLHERRMGSGAFEAVVKRAQRRFNSDGTVSRVETALDLILVHTSAQSSDLHLEKLIRDCAELPCRVRDGVGDWQSRPLVGCANALAKHYLQATTRMALRASTQPWWVCCGTPTLLVMNAGNKRLPLPEHAQPVLRVGRLSVSHWWRRFGATACSVWFVQAPERQDPRLLHRLRVHLLRLHAERECLRLVITLIHRGTFDFAATAESSDLTQDYLNEAIRRIERTERSGIPQSPLLDAARTAIEGAMPGTATTLRQMRRQIASKVARYIERSQRAAQIVNAGDRMNTTIQIGNVSVTGDFSVVTARNIQESFNKTSGASLNAELKERLRALTVQVGQLAAQLPKDEAEKVSQDLQTLTAEATSKSPRKKWYDLSAEGLIEAAKTVAEMAAPVSASVKAVLALLAQ